jgi:hypothetical protein
MCLLPLCLLTLKPVVRLSGPVNGRIGVCRDLDRDLARVKELGVGCIVWLVIDLCMLYHQFPIYSVIAVWTIASLNTLVCPGPIMLESRTRRGSTF